MPIEATRLPEYDRYIFSGVLTEGELIDGALAVAKYEATTSPLPNRIMDLTLLTGLELNFAVMEEFSRIRANSRLPNRVLSVVVAPQLVQYGFGRMYQALNTNPNLRIAVVRSMDEALAWLRNPSSDPDAP